MEEEYLCDCLMKCEGVSQHVSQANYYHHTKYCAPKVTIFDKTLTTLIQANSANSSSVQLNDSDLDVQPTHHHTLKCRCIDSGTHALSDDKQIIPAVSCIYHLISTDLLLLVRVMHLRTTMTYLRSIWMHSNITIMPFLGQTTWTCTQGKMTQTGMQGRMTLQLSCRISRTPRDMTETRMCHPMSPRRKKFKGALMMQTLKQTILSD
jgi:hypothetical protein